MQLQTLFLQGARPPAAAWALDGDGVHWLLARQILHLAARQVFMREQDSSDLLRQTRGCGRDCSRFLSRVGKRNSSLCRGVRFVRTL